MNTIHIFDIDTTIADNTARAELLRKTCIVCLAAKPSGHRAICPACGIETRSSTAQEDWDKFFDPKLVIQDKVVAKALVYANKLRAKGVPVHFITGRGEACRDVTLQWLKENFNHSDAEMLIMRSEREDGLLASEYKDRAWRRLCASRGYKETDLFFFYEDDPHVFHTYNKHGVVVQCPEAWEYLVPEGSDEEEKAFAIL